VDVELVEVRPDRRDELAVVQPDEMRAALEGIVDLLEAERRNAADLVESEGVVEEKMLADVSEKSDRARGIEAHGVTGGDPVVVGDLVCVAVVGRIEQEQADT